MKQLSNFEKPKRGFCLLFFLAVVFASSFLVQTTAIAAYIDVPSDHWASEAIATLSEGGLLNGYGDNMFGPSDKLSVAQLATVITRACGGYEYEDAGYWATGSLLYCRDDLVCLPDFGEITNEAYDVLCSREVAAFMIINGICDVCGLPQERDSIPDIPDLNDATADYRDAIVLAYRHNIIVGVDNAGTFAPHESVTRAELAVIFYRIGVTSPIRESELLAPATRSVNYSDEHILKIYRNLVRPTKEEFIQSPTTEDEFINNIAYMSSIGEYKMVLYYPYDTSREKLQTYADMATNAAEYYPELGYRCKFSYIIRKSSGTDDVPLIVFFCDKNDLNAPSVQYGEEFPLSDKKRIAAMRVALKIRESLYASGKLTTDMSEFEKAKVLYFEILNCCAYETSKPTPDNAHLPYAALCLGSAVCDGYTGAYNLLLRLEGINCRGILSDHHLWSEAVLDGTTYHIDTTWGDAGIDPLFLFAMDPKESWVIHNRDQK